MSDHENFNSGLLQFLKKSPTPFHAVREIENLLQNLGIAYEIRTPLKSEPTNWIHPGRSATITIKDQYAGFIGEIHPSLLAKFSIKSRATIWGINYDLIGKSINSNKKYQPIPKYPVVIEDLSLIVPENTQVGDVLTIIKKSSPLVNSVELLDVHENSTTFRISYLDRTKNLTEKGKLHDFPHFL
jgi:phenylalanyl-tRNA synthetase beta chain